MSSGGRATYIGVVHRFRMQRMDPEFRHGDIYLALVEKGIFGNFESNSGGLGVRLHPSLVKLALHSAVKVFSKHICQRAAEVPEKTVADVGASNDSSGENGQIRCRVVAAPVLEFRDHLIGPVLH